MNSRSLLLLLMLFFFSSLEAQQPGYIVRPAGGPGSSVLNPNGDAYTSSTTSGFTSNDITQSEIAFVKIPPLQTEPLGDLATGPDGGYSDIIGGVTNSDNSGCYIYYNSASGYVLFRFRIGGIVSGAKAYNILIDTDLKMGASGASADPNYIAAANAGNGNPGFEIEIALLTGSSTAVKIYDVDGKASGSGNLPVENNSYDGSTYSIISVALSRASGDADYFYDFYVPYSALSALSLSNTTSFRIIATTNTNPGSAFHGTRSDIMGINDDLYSNTTDAWEYVAKNTPSIILNNVTAGSSGFTSGACTAAPAVDNGIPYGSNISVTGTWTKLSESSVTTATITVYKNGVSQGTTTCTSGSTWSYTISSVSQGDIITAKAQGTGESMCLLSNSVSAQSSCTSANTTPTTSFSISCVTNRGIMGTMPAGGRVNVYTIQNNGTISLFADDNSTPLKVTYGGSSTTTGTAWEYQDDNNGGTSDACSGGSPDMPEASFVATVYISPKCESSLVFPSSPTSCDFVTATPTITQTVLYSYSTTISGTSTTGYRIFLLINGIIITTTTAASNAFTFSNLSLNVGDIVEVRAKAPDVAGSGSSVNVYCVSSAATLTVKCFTNAPVINTDLEGYLTTSATTISGTSSESINTTINVYQSPSTLLGTTTVQANGTWSVAVSALGSGVSIFATAQNGGCQVSSNSTSATTRSATTVCPTITGSYAEAASTVSGTFASNFTGTVYIYQDGSQVGSGVVSNSTTWSVSINSSTPLYSGGVLTVAAQETGKTINSNCASTVTVTCSAPATPSVSPTSSTLSTLNQTVTYTISNSVSGVLYSIIDQTTGASYASSQFGNGGSLSFTTTAGSFNTSNTVYNLYIQADKLSGATCKSNTSATITTGTLPVTWLSISVLKNISSAVVLWSTASEQNTKDFEVQYSTNATSWDVLGTVQAAGNSSATRNYSFTHQTPLKNSAYNYYRILQRDLDGKFSYSKIVSIIFNEPGLDFLVYPNPADKVVTIYLSDASEVSLINSAGSVVWRSKLPAGRNQLPIEKFSAGTYFIRTNTGAQRLVIQ